MIYHIYFRPIRGVEIGDTQTDIFLQFGTEDQVLYFKFFMLGDWSELPSLDIGMLPNYK